MTEEAQLQDQCHLLIDGEDAPEAARQAIIQIRVEQGLHLPALCLLVLQDDDLELVDGSDFEVGKGLEIEMGTGDELETVFKGEIVGLELQPRAPGTLSLVVRAYDRSHRLHRGRKTRSFVQMTDSDLATRIAREVGLQPDVESTSEVYDYILQDNRTNYQFLRERAERIGFSFWVDDDKLCFKRPAANPPAPTTVGWGQTLQQFHPILTAGRQVNEVVVRGWDPAQKRAIVGRATQARGTPEIGEDRSGGELAQEAFGEAQAIVVHRPVATQGEADALAQSLCDELGNAFVQAEGQATGNSEIKPGTLVEVENLGERFSGQYYVTKTVHSISNQIGYRTHFVVSGSQAATLRDLLQQQQQEEFRSWICVGVVTNNDDPEGMGRVKVKFPWLGDDVESTWARIAAPMAGPDRGFYFLPEVNDEVLVAFEHGDVRRPYVLGALWNGSDSPPESGVVDGSGRVVKRVIRTRAGHTILLDDSDGGGGITIEDKNGNKIALESGSGKLTMEVSGDLEIKATNITIEAQAEVEISGSAGVSVETPAQLKLEGSLIALN